MAAADKAAAAADKPNDAPTTPTPTLTPEKERAAGGGAEAGMSPHRRAKSPAAFPEETGEGVIALGDDACMRSPRYVMTVIGLSGQVRMLLLSNWRC